MVARLDKLPQDVWTPGEVAPSVRRLPPKTYTRLVHGTTHGGDFFLNDLIPNVTADPDKIHDVIPAPAIWFADDLAISKSYATPFRTPWDKGEIMEGRIYTADIKAQRPVEVDTWYSATMSNKIDAIEKQYLDGKMSEDRFLDLTFDLRDLMDAAPPLRERYRLAAEQNPDMIIRRLGKGRDRSAHYIVFDPDAVHLRQVSDRRGQPLYSHRREYQPDGEHYRSRKNAPPRDSKFGRFGRSRRGL